MNIAHRFLLGRYTGRQSLVSKTDPRLKILFMILVSVTLLKLDTPRGFVLPFFFLAAVAAAGRVKLNLLVRGVLPIIWLTVITFLLHALLPPHDINTAAAVSFRLLLLFGWASVITATTGVMDLGRAVAWYLYPLKILGVKPGDIALTFTLAIRFFPFILEEAESILKAQKLRGSGLGFKKKLESFVTVFFIRVLKKTEKIEDTLKNRDLNPDSLVGFQAAIKSSMNANILFASAAVSYIYLMVLYCL